MEPASNAPGVMEYWSDVVPRLPIGYRRCAMRVALRGLFGRE
jgi:hypothetical protein